MPERRRTIRIWDDTVSSQYQLCRGCNARIWWGRTVANNKPICFDEVPVADRREVVEVDDFPRPKSREVRYVDADKVHWGKCPAAQRFREAQS